MNDTNVIKAINYTILQADAHRLADKVKASGKKYNSVYGIPSGGLIPAYIIAMNLEVPLVTKPGENTLVVDDLSDSGSTLLPYKDKGYHTAVLYAKKHCPVEATFELYRIENNWVELPHEAGEVSGIETNVRRILQYIGEDPNREGLLDTPKRVAKAWKQMTDGYTRKFEDEITVFEGEGFDQIVLLRDIEFHSICEHHMLGFSGKGHIAYIPDKNIVGISKLARVLDIFSRRLQNQERITKQVADCLQEQLKPRAVAVILEAQHSCMRCRGVGKQGSVMVTSMLLGGFKDDDKARLELMNLIK